MRFALILLVILIALSIVDCHKKKRRHNRRGHDHKHHHRRGHQKRGHGHHGHHGFEKSSLFNPLAQLSGRSGLAPQSRIEARPSGNENLEGYPECYLLDSITEKCGDHSLNTILTKMKPCSDQKLLKKISGHAVRACRRNGNLWLNAAKALVSSKGNRFYLDFAEFQTESYKIRGDQLRESLANHLFKNQRPVVLVPEKKIQSPDNNLTNSEVVNVSDLSGVDKLKVLLSRDLEVTSDAPEAKNVQVSLNDAPEFNITQGEGEANELDDEEKNEDFDALKYVEDTLESAKLKFRKFIEFFKQDEGNGTSIKEANERNEKIPLMSKLSDMLTLLGRVVSQDTEPNLEGDVTILEPVDEEHENSGEEKMIETTEERKTEGYPSDENDSKASPSERNDESTDLLTSEKQEADNNVENGNKSDNSGSDATTEESGSVERDVELDEEINEPEKRVNPEEGGSDQNDQDRKDKGEQDESKSFVTDATINLKPDEPVEIETSSPERDSNSDGEGDSSNLEKMGYEGGANKEEDPVIVVEPNPEPTSVNADGEIFSILVKDESESEEVKDGAGGVVLSQSEKENLNQARPAPFDDEKNDEEATKEDERILNQLDKEFGNSEDNLSMPDNINMEDLKAEIKGGNVEGNLIPENLKKDIWKS